MSDNQEIPLSFRLCLLALSFRPCLLDLYPLTAVYYCAAQGALGRQTPRVRACRPDLLFCLVSFLLLVPQKMYLDRASGPLGANMSAFRYHLGSQNGAKIDGF